MRQTWGERKEGMEREGESQSHGGEGRREGREARPNSHVYARATGRAGREAGVPRERGEAQPNRAVTQMHQGPSSTAGDWDKGRASPAGEHAAWLGACSGDQGTPTGTNVTQWLSPTVQRKRGAIRQSREPSSPGAGTAKGLQSKHRRAPGPFPPLLPCCERGARQNGGISSAPHRLRQQHQPHPSTGRGPSRCRAQQYCAGFFLSVGLKIQA